MSDPAPGWFPDPLDRYDHRYFNGTSWTSDVSNDGVRHVDPLGSRPDERVHPSGGQNRGNRMATAAVVTGSIALVIAWIPFVVLVGAILATLAVVFGVRGLRRARDIGSGRGSSIAGIVMGIVGLGASVVGVVLSVMVWREIVAFIEPGPNVAEVTACAIDGREATVNGTIENRDDRRRTYVVFVDIDGRTDFAIVDDVAPGSTRDWTTTVTTPAAPDGCEPDLIVHGPFPFDVEIDPVNR